MWRRRAASAGTAVAAIALAGLALGALVALAGGWLEVFWGIVAVLICLQIIGVRFGPPSRPTPTTSNPPQTDDAHDAAVSVAAVLGVRDGLHRD